MADKEWPWWTTFWFDDSDGKGFRLGPLTVCAVYSERVRYWYVGVCGHPLWDGLGRRYRRG